MPHTFTNGTSDSASASLSRGTRVPMSVLAIPLGRKICNKPEILLVKPTARLDIPCKAKLIQIIAVAMNRNFCANIERLRIVNREDDR